MSKTLKEQPDAIAVAEIVRHGEQLTLPEGMTLKQAKKLIERRMAYEEEPTAFDEAYDYFPFDGANALNDVLVEKFGWAPATSTPSFWGDEPPRLISVEIAPGVFKQEPWGRFSLPNIEGHIETGVARKGNRYTFSLTASIRRKDEQTVRSLFAEVRRYLKSRSIYAGQAIKIRFRDDDGKVLKRSEEHTSELQSLMRISSAVFCLN